MTRFEYKHVRFDYGLLAAWDKQTFDKRLTQLLNEQGAEGWELKASFAEGTFHTHLVFGRPRPQGLQGESHGSAP
jgi:hypothetical protein